MEKKSHLEQEIEALRLKVLEMAARVEEALQKALRAVNERDEELAESVVDGDREINEMQYDIDEKCLQLLARETPVAVDLRFILGCTYIAGNLERVADQAVNISERALLLAQRPAMPRNPLLEELEEVALEMLRTVLRAYVENDPVSARRVCDMDNRADTLNLQILKEYIHYMVEESRAVERAVHLITVSKCLERVGDLSTNIAENIIFVIKGVDIRQTCQPY